MKAIVAAACGAILAAGLLASCEQSTPTTGPVAPTEAAAALPSDFTMIATDNDGCYKCVYAFTDRDTGCQYLLFSGYKKGGVIPRLNSAGKPWCEK